MSKEDRNIPVWQCGICNFPCVDQESLLDRHFSAIRDYIFKDDADGTKWVLCYDCGTWYHLSCVVSMSTSDSELKFPYQCTTEGCRKQYIKRDFASETYRKLDLHVHLK